MNDKVHPIDSVRGIRNKIKPEKPKSSWVEEYASMDALSVYVAFGICKEVDALKEYSSDVYKLMDAIVNGKMNDLEREKGRDWMIVSTLMLKRCQSEFFAKNRKVVYDLIYMYDIQEGMFDFEKNFYKIALNILRQRFNVIEEGGKNVRGWTDGTN